MSRLKGSLKTAGYKVTESTAPSKLQIDGYAIDVNSDSRRPAIKPEGFVLEVSAKTINIFSNDPSGAMYGLLQLAEEFDAGKKPAEIATQKHNPQFTVRALKFNLPWSSYRTGIVMEQHELVCKDLGFWRSFLDEMAMNRFNVLSLWNVHPFSFMVKPHNFPKANNFTGQEISEWKSFWTSLFKMAKDRGIETFIVNWNIAVSPEFAEAYHVAERNDTSAIVKRYTREVVTQVINEYPDLSGIGVTLADWMSNFSSPGSKLPEMTAKTREDWIAETFVAGMKDANRPVRFLHRSVLSADPKEMRRVIDGAGLRDTTLVEIKFNWSHGHSTPVLAITHDSHSGKIDNGYWEPMPSNYRIQWMIRNEDFFILRWGQPDFIRAHIARNSDPYVNGYFVGSEGYIPAKDFSHVASDHRTWKYAFEKQWLFYMMWGRLLYDPSTPNVVFESAFEKHNGKGTGPLLFKAFVAAGNMPLRFASYHAATWDYTLYAEGFLAPFPSGQHDFDASSAFVSIDELINHPTLDPGYISIADFVNGSKENRQYPNSITPTELADSLTRDAQRITDVVSRLRSRSNPTLQCELDDLETWAYLSYYFADKLRAGVSLALFRADHRASDQNKAIALLTRCVVHWKKVVSITSKHYHEVPYVDDQSALRQPNHDAHTFSWKKYLPQVERDVRIAKGQ